MGCAGQTLVTLIPGVELTTQVLVAVSWTTRPVQESAPAAVAVLETLQQSSGIR